MRGRILLSAQLLPERTPATLERSVADPPKAGPTVAERPTAGPDSPESTEVAALDTPRPDAPAEDPAEPEVTEPQVDEPEVKVPEDSGSAVDAPPVDEAVVDDPPVDEAVVDDPPVEDPPKDPPDEAPEGADAVVAGPEVEGAVVPDGVDADLPVMDPGAETLAGASEEPSQALDQAPEPARAEPRPIVRFLDRVVLLALLVEVAAVFGVVRYGFSQPFWYDEQQRAYQLALPMRQLWESLGDAELPLPLGWIAVEKGFAATFGQVEWALRLPVAVCVMVLAIATYVVARRLIGVVGSALIAAALVINGFLAHYIVQIKQYPAEMALTVVALLLWLQAGDPGRSRWDQAGRYLGILLCLLTSIATAFAAAPLLALDLVRVVRGRRMLPRALMALVTGGIAVAHLVLFVLPQNKVAGAGSYW